MTLRLNYKQSVGATALAILTTGGLMLASANAETLTGAVEKVLSGHPKAKAAKAQADVAHYEAMEIRGSLLPRLNVGGTFGPSYRNRDVSGLVDSGAWLDQSQGNLSVRQRLFQGGLAWNDTKAAKGRAEAARLLAVDVDQRLALSVIEAYLAILRGQEQVRLSRENASVHEDTLKKTTARKDAGRATQADIELVKARLGLSRSSVETRKALLENAKVRYRNLVGEEPMGLQSVGRLGSHIPAKVEHADISGNPTLRAAKSNYEASKFQSKAAKGLLMPLFELELGGSLGNDVGGVRGADEETHAFLVASWDVWEGGARRAQKSQREEREVEALNLALDAQLQVEEELGAAIADRNGALLTEKQLTGYATSIAKVVTAYEKQVEVGSRAVLNMLDVKNEDFRANSALVDSQFASLMAGYRVIAATGTLVAVVAPNARGAVDSEEGGKNVVPAPQAPYIEEREVAAPVMAVQEVEVIEEAPVAKKKGLFARMFAGKKSRAAKNKSHQAYQAYEAAPAITEESVTPAPTPRAAAEKGKAYSWSAVSQEKSKMKKQAAPEVVEAVQAVESEESIEAAPVANEKKGGFLKFLKPRKTMKAVEQQEVQTGAVDEVAQIN